MTKSRTSAEVKNRYNNKAYDRIALSVPKGTKDAWKDRAAALGISLNAYIRECVLAAEKTGYFEN